MNVQRIGYLYLDRSHTFLSHSYFRLFSFCILPGVLENWTRKEKNNYNVKEIGDKRSLKEKKKAKINFIVSYIYFWSLKYLSTCRHSIHIYQLAPFKKLLQTPSNNHIFINLLTSRYSIPTHQLNYCQAKCSSPVPQQNIDSTLLYLFI